MCVQQVCAVSQTDLRQITVDLYLFKSPFDWLLLIYTSFIRRVEDIVCDV